MMQARCSCRVDACARIRVDAMQGPRCGLLPMASVAVCMHGVHVRAHKCVVVRVDADACLSAHVHVCLCCAAQFGYVVADRPLRTVA